MLKSSEQILEETKKWFEETKIEWKKHLSGEEKDPILTLREEGDPQVAGQIKQVLGWMDEALEEDSIEGWKKFYEKWNGDQDYTSKDKYDGDKDLTWKLADLQDFLIEWEMSSQQELIKKLQNLLQTAGINHGDENAQEQVEGIKKVQDDLTDLGIDKTRVKEIIENERNEHKLKIKRLINNYFGKDAWEEVKIEAQIEVKKN